MTPAALPRLRDAVEHLSAQLDQVVMPTSSLALIMSALSAVEAAIDDLEAGDRTRCPECGSTDLWLAPDWWDNDLDAECRRCEAMFTTGKPDPAEHVATVPARSADYREVTRS